MINIVKDTDNRRRRHENHLEHDLLGLTAVLSVIEQ